MGQLTASCQQAHDALAVAMWELERGNVAEAAEQVRQASEDLDRTVDEGRA